MNVSRPPFGDPVEVRRAAAGNAAYRRAIDLGYGADAARSFAATARDSSNEYESPERTAARVVHPPRGRFTGKPGGAA